MSDHVYRVVEVVGSSPIGVTEAITSAVDRANTTLDNLDWFQVSEIRGHIADGHVAHFQVTVKVGFQLRDDVE